MYMYGAGVSIKEGVGEDQKKTIDTNTWGKCCMVSWWHTLYIYSKCYAKIWSKLYNTHNVQLLLIMPCWHYFVVNFHSFVFQTKIMKKKHEVQATCIWMWSTKLDFPAKNETSIQFINIEIKSNYRVIVS